MIAQKSQTIWTPLSDFQSPSPYKKKKKSQPLICSEQNQVLRSEAQCCTGLFDGVVALPEESLNQHFMRKNTTGKKKVLPRPAVLNEHAQRWRGPVEVQLPCLCFSPPGRTCSVQSSHRTCWRWLLLQETRWALSAAIATRRRTWLTTARPIECDTSALAHSSELALRSFLPGENIPSPSPSGQPMNSRIFFSVSCSIRTKTGAIS